MNQPETSTAEAVIAPPVNRPTVEQVLEAHLQDHLREDPRLEATVVQLQNQVAALRDEVEHWRHRTERGRLAIWLAIGVTALVAIISSAYLMLRPMPLTTMRPATPADESPHPFEPEVVQMGVFKRRANAERLLQKLQEQGLDVTVTPRDDRLVVTVLASSPIARDEAMRLKKALKLEPAQENLTIGTRDGSDR